MHVQTAHYLWAPKTIVAHHGAPLHPALGGNKALHKVANFGATEAARIGNIAGLGVDLVPRAPNTVHQKTFQYVVSGFTALLAALPDVIGILVDLIAKQVHRYLLPSWRLARPRAVALGPLGDYLAHIAPHAAPILQRGRYHLAYECATDFRSAYAA